jgi:Asp-tRNA(Asn)/Glu-tRNA(Gln) amidotransferase A subunit family amidase
MQLIGPLFGEDAIFRAGRMFEQASGISRLKPPIAG